MKNWMALCVIALSFSGLCVGTPLTLSQVLESALENDAAAEAIIQRKRQTEYLKDLSMPTSQILFEFRNEYGLSTRGQGNTSVLSAGASKEFQDTGTSIALEYTDSTQIGRTEKTVQLRVEQSLFKNFFGTQTRTLGRALDQETEVVLLDVAEAFEDYLAEVINRYLDWQLAHLKAQAAEALLDEAKKLSQNVARRRAKSVASSIDVDKAQIQYLSRQESLLKEKAEFLALTEQVAVLAGLSGELIPNTVAPFQKANLDFEADIKRTESQARRLQLLGLQEKASVDRLDFARADRRPDLRLIAGYNFDNSTRFSVNVDRGEALVGVNLVYPLGDSQAEAAVQQAVLEKDQANLSKKIAQREIRGTLYALRKTIETKRKETDLGAQRLKLSKSLAKQERKRYAQGRIDFETLLTAENTLATSQFSALGQQVELAKLVVDWLRETDQLLAQKTGKVNSKHLQSP